MEAVYELLNIEKTMQFEQKCLRESIGRKTGFLCAYLLFTTILFFILSSLDKLPANWSVIHVFGLTAIIMLVGTGVKRFLNE